MKTQIAIGSTQHPGNLDDYLAQTPEPRQPHFYISRQGTVTGLHPIDTDRRFIPCVPRAANRRAVSIALEGGGPLTLDPTTRNFTYPDDPTPRIPYEYCERAQHNRHRHYEYFPDRQLAALATLIRTIAAQLQNPPRYSNRLSVYTPDAANGKPAVFLRLSYSPKLHDPHPQPELLTTIRRTLQTQ